MSTEDKGLIEEALRTFEQFKEANDKKLAELDSGKASEAVLDEKLAKLTTDLLELNRRAQDAADELKATQQRLSAAETELNTPKGESSTMYLKELMFASAKDPRNMELKSLLHKEERDAASTIEKKHMDSLFEWMKAPKDGMLIAGLRSVEKEVNAELAAKGVEIGTGNLGGNAMPQVLSRQIERMVREIGTMRLDALVRQTSSADYRELVDVNNATAGWAGEKAVRSETNTPNLEAVDPPMGMSYAYPTATEESMSDIFFDVANWLVVSCGEAMAQNEGASFISGTGTDQPEGLLAGTAPNTDPDGARAFGRLQYLATGVAGDWPASNPADLLIDLRYTVKAGYRANAMYRMNKSLLGEVMKFKDSQGAYYWQPAIALGQPSTLGAFPVREDEAMPDKAADSYSVAFGDFRRGYVIVDHARFGMRISVDDNITTPGFIKWYIRRRVAGKKLNTEAVKLIKFALT